MANEWILCALVESPGEVYPGSEKTQCEKCEREIWISPASQKFIANDGYHAICERCAFKMRDSQTTFAVTPEHARELDAWRRRN